MCILWFYDYCSSSPNVLLLPFLEDGFCHYQEVQSYKFSLREVDISHMWESRKQNFNMFLPLWLMLLIHMTGFVSPQPENLLTGTLAVLMILPFSKRLIKSYNITGHNFYNFQFHDLLTKMTAGHCNFVFFLREAISLGTRLMSL